MVVDRLHDYHDLFDNLPLMYFALDSEGAVVEVNRFGAEQLGYEQTELVGNSVLDVFHPDDRDSVRTQFRALLDSPGQVAHWEFRKKRKDGSQLWVQESARAVENDAGETLVMVVCEDITSRKETEQRLERYRNRLKQLTIELSLAEEAERRRIATGLHDEIGQKLALAKLRLEELPVAEDKPAAALEGIRGLLDEAIEETRSLTFELASPVLYELGLGAALQTLAEHFSQSDGPAFSFAETGTPRELTERTQLVLYRIVRELMLNVVKHARAKSAGVLVSWLYDQIQIEVRDDGIGFDPAAADDPERIRSYGLFKTRERLDQLGGQLEVHSEAASGTVATVCAPTDTSKNQ
ncbi:MAG: PAS domain S-box protein [Acidobacteriota bacterium]|nr:PAS domain S-box protein [Acidobacteriota bacterium]